MLQIPGATSYIGCIGKDKFGDEMKKNSKLSCVNVSFAFTSKLVLFLGKQHDLLSILISFPLLYISSCEYMLYLCVQAQYLEDKSAATGTCAVCIVSGERSVQSQCVFIVMNIGYRFFETLC